MQLENKSSEIALCGYLLLYLYFETLKKELRTRTTRPDTTSTTITIFSRSSVFLIVSSEAGVRAVDGGSICNSSHTCVVRPIV